MKHEPSPTEIAALRTVVERDLTDCQTRGLSPDWRLNIAYNAALQVATAALAASGFRASREAQHYRVIQSLLYTLAIDRRTIQRLEAFRKKRNISDYERAGNVTSTEAEEMIALAQQLQDELVRWLAANHPELLDVSA